MRIHARPSPRVPSVIPAALATEDRGVAMTATDASTPRPSSPTPTSGGVFEEAGHAHRETAKRTSSTRCARDSGPNAAQNVLQTTQPCDSSAAVCYTQAGCSEAPPCSPPSSSPPGANHGGRGAPRRHTRQAGRSRPRRLLPPRRGGRRGSRSGIRRQPDVPRRARNRPSSGELGRHRGHIGPRQTLTVPDRRGALHPLVGRQRRLLISTSPSTPGRPAGRHHQPPRLAAHQSPASGTTPARQPDGRAGVHLPNRVL